MVLKNNYFQERATYGIKGISLLSCQFLSREFQWIVHTEWNHLGNQASPTSLYGQREREVRNKNDLFQFFDLMRSLLFHAYNSSTIRLIKEE